MSNPQGPYGQQSGDQGQPAPQYPQQPYQPYQQQPYAGYTAPRKPLDLAKLVAIGAWVVLGLYALKFLYVLADDDYGDFADRFFGSMPELGTGVFFTGVLLAVGVWLHRNQEPG
ncbi:MAG: hypothetical protein C0P77_004200 [Thermoanaerobacterales bacterium]|jgi:hypothetical protein|nr:hypothetical protein [Thermoanaerobacterales bacterium]